MSKEGGLSVAFTLNGGCSTFPAGPCPTPPALSLTGESDGSYTLTVTATDTAGNTSPAGTAAYLLDTTTPTRPLVRAPASPTQGRSPSFGITAESGAALPCTLTRGSATLTAGPSTDPAAFDLTG